MLEASKLKKKMKFNKNIEIILNYLLNNKYFSLNSV